MVVGVVDVVDVKYCYDESGRMFRRGDLIDDSNINPRGITRFDECHDEREQK